MSKSNLSMFDNIKCIETLCCSSCKKDKTKVDSNYQNKSIFKHDCGMLYVCCIDCIKKVAKGQYCEACKLKITHIVSIKNNNFLKELKKFELKCQKDKKSLFLKKCLNCSNSYHTLVQHTHENCMQKTLLCMHCVIEKEISCPACFKPYRGFLAPYYSFSQSLKNLQSQTNNSLKRKRKNVEHFGDFIDSFHLEDIDNEEKLHETDKTLQVEHYSLDNDMPSPKKPALRNDNCEAFNQTIKENKVATPDFRLLDTKSLESSTRDWNNFVYVTSKFQVASTTPHPISLDKKMDISQGNSFGSIPMEKSGFLDSIIQNITSEETCLDKTDTSSEYSEDEYTKIEKNIANILISLSKLKSKNCKHKNK